MKKNATTLLTPRSPIEVEDGSAFASVAIVIIRGEPFGRCYEIKDVPLLIGRSSNCQIELDEDSVSRTHCQIWRGRKKILIRDLGSTNKTMVNSIEIREQELRNGDLISIGDSVMKFVANDLLAEYHSELYGRTMIDPLTELANRRRFDQALINEVEKAQDARSELSLVILDIDFFKRINDDFDHVFGDLVLQGVAQLIGAAVGVGEVAARLGGEEFALLLPRAGITEAKRRCIELCKKVSQRQFEHEDQPVFVTMSAGIAACNNKVKNDKVLLRVADLAMLKAKEDGRNCVRLAK